MGSSNSLDELVLVYFKNHKSNKFIKSVLKSAIGLSQTTWMNWPTAEHDKNKKCMSPRQKQIPAVFVA